ncbi:MAG: flavodoxin-dependent (E)-4-hydroxy-3-methylbut-2-enyl-diphosphate synthase, partial [Deltaproteobacteria bacterium]|nr:flavodoxin-dependent (E)-4-hydroxy-3-methylbut-2-enyl-diphosphate synthase [Deltaproteobacteria bacterium]
MNTKGIADKSGRVKTRAINVGGVVVGGGAPISVQSMTNTNTADSEATIAQINRLTEAGCEIVRVAVPDAESAKALVTIKKAITIPLIADIHFDWRLAIEALKNGVDALRLNPGNIGSKERIGHVVRATAERGIPIRIGVNGGSLEKEILEEFGHPSPEAMVQSALKHIRILEDLNFTDIKVSLKASSVPVTIAAYRLLSSKVDYPLHIG